jgi:hypothetical protein
MQSVDDLLGIADRAARCITAVWTHAAVVKEIVKADLLFAFHTHFDRKTLTHSTASNSHHTLIAAPSTQ